LFSWEERNTTKYSKLTRQRRAVAVIFFIAALFAETIAYSKEPYLRKNDLTCGNAKIQIITRCTGESNSIIPDCVEQNFWFTDQTTEKTIFKNASGKRVTVKDAKGKTIGQYLDALATGWICAKGKSQLYLIVWYNTGGNCDECEWQEILDLNGKKIATTLPKTRQNIESYDDIWLKLGLPSISPKDFLDVQLR
jgi:hypothetical protein